MAGRFQLLAVEPDCLHFENNEERALELALEHADEHTVHMDLLSPSDIRLDETGKLRSGGFRFTTLALAQICQKLCPGLSKLAFTVSGMVRGPEDPPEIFSVPMASRIINELATIRFDFLRGRQLIRDTRTGLIEGLTGSGYQFLSNKEFYERVRDSIEQSPVKQKFHEAILVGRRLTLYYRHQKPVAELTTSWSTKSPDAFYEGYDLTNSETGDCAVRTAPVLLMGNHDAVSLRGPRRRRLIHSGSKFARNLILSLQRTFTDRDVVRKLGYRLGELSDISLGFGQLKEEEHKNRFMKFVNVLGQHKLTRSCAERVMRVALYQNAKRHDRPGSIRTGLENRTHYDLLVALMCEARQVSPAIQETVERTAYNLLINRLHLPA